MRGHKIAKSIFAILFCAALVCYAALCLSGVRDGIRAALSDIRIPLSPKEAGEMYEKVDAALNDGLYRKDLFFDIHAALQRLMGKHETGGFGILRDRNEVLEYGRIERFSNEEARAQALKLWKLQGISERRGVRFLYVMPPPRHRRNATDAYIAGLPYPNIHPYCDAIFYNLHRYGVAGLDPRAAFDEDARPSDGGVFRTDDRMTAEMAFAVFSVSVAELNNRFGAGLDAAGVCTDINSYVKKTYENAFLGNIGKQAGMAFGGLDDFTVLWPAFPSRYTLSITDAAAGEGEFSGACEETLLRPIALTEAAERRDPYSADLYGVYRTVGCPVARIVNDAATPDMPRLLLIHDGDAAPMAVFLAPLFIEITLLEFGEDAAPSVYTANRLREFIKKSAPDYVIVESRAENLEYL
jgi:hypothetical protein